MFKPCCIIYLETDQHVEKIRKIAEEKKIVFYWAAQGDQLSQIAKTYAPFLMIVDLSGLDSGWLFRHISILSHTKQPFPLCAIVDDEQENVRMRAEKYGCDKIVTKSEFIRKLPDIVESALRKTLE